VARVAQQIWQPRPPDIARAGHGDAAGLARQFRIRFRLLPAPIVCARTQRLYSPRNALYPSTDASQRPAIPFRPSQRSR
jgi:hypothetical protein